MPNAPTCPWDSRGNGSQALERWRRSKGVRRAPCRSTARTPITLPSNAPTARRALARLAEQQAKGLPPAPPLPTLPSGARWHALLAQARLFLETARDKMQSYADDRSETWQQGERAAALQEHIDNLGQILDDLDALPPF